MFTICLQSPPSPTSQDAGPPPPHFFTESGEREKTPKPPKRVGGRSHRERRTRGSPSRAGAGAPPLQSADWSGSPWPPAARRHKSITVSFTMVYAVLYRFLLLPYGRRNADKETAVRGIESQNRVKGYFVECFVHFAIFVFFCFFY